jgi:hypothetical protein
MFILEKIMKKLLAVLAAGLLSASVFASEPAKTAPKPTDTTAAPAVEAAAPAPAAGEVAVNTADAVKAPAVDCSKKENAKNDACKKGHK